MKVAIVTGNAKGLGQAISLALSQEGTYREPEIIRSAEYDITQVEEAERLIDDTIKKYGRLDLLVNNVGNYIHKNISDFTVTEWQEMMDSNLNSAFYLSRRALAALRQSQGRILNIGYAGAEHFRTFPNSTAYQVAKTGLLVLTQGLAKAEAKNGVLVNMLSPGHMENTVVEVDLASIPLGRLATLDEAVEAAMFLIKHNYITGQNIELAGGWAL